MSDEEIESKVHDAVVEEIVTKLNPKSGNQKLIRYRIKIDDIGEGFITRKYFPKGMQLLEGTPLSVEIKKEQSTEKRPKSTVA